MEWISVKDRLPDHGEIVLTNTPKTEITYAEMKIISYGSMKSGFPSGVSHWMPLPEPPKN